MITIGNEKTDYGNWVPAAMMKMCYAACMVLGIGEAACILLKVNSMVLVVI